MELGPIFRALMHNPTRFWLITVEIALTLAIVVNCVAIILEQRHLLTRPSGLDEPNLVVVTTDPFAKDFAEGYGARVRSYKKFGTAVVIFPDGFKIDVATARLEYYEYPAALPTVELSSLKLDLYRRDFTMNTLAVELDPGRFGQLIDYFGAQRDFKDKTIRVLHNYSFVEDPTRVFRAIRYEQRLGFRIGKHTSNLIVNAVKMDLLVQLSGRRLTNELKLILSEENPLNIEVKYSINRIIFCDVLSCESCSSCLKIFCLSSYKSSYNSAANARK